MNKILYLSVVKEYYRQNTIFIFAVMMFAFGFLRANEHLSIINEALNSPMILSCFAFGWILYALKVTLFTLRRISLKQSEFLYHLVLFPRTKRFLAFMSLQFSLIQLTFFYAFFMLGKAAIEKNWWASAVILAVNILIVILGALVYEWKINKPNSQQNTVRKYFNIRFKTPQFLFFPRYLITNQTVLFLITKTFTALGIMGVCYLFPTDDYDIRLISLGSLIVAFSQMVILINFKDFERQYFSLYRNMPISTVKWFLTYLITLFVLLIPEMIVLVRNWPIALSWTNYALQILFIISLTCVLLHYQFFISRDSEQGFQILFFFGIGLALLIMFKVPVLGLSFFGLVVSYAVLKKKFYKVE